MKILNGAEIAAYMKENQAHQVRSLRAHGVRPKLVILRDSNNPVITKYVQLKQHYGEDIGVVVEDWYHSDVAAGIQRANTANDVHAMIIQLPLQDHAKTDDLVRQISPNKDVDGLATEMCYSSGDIIFAKNDNTTPIDTDKNLMFNSFGDIKPSFESATATAINWLLAGYDVQLQGKKIAIVGRGRLVGAPLARMWQTSGYDVTVFRRQSNLAELVNYDIIVSATGVPHLIKPEMVKSGAVVVDAGTASEDGVLMGDVDESVRERGDLAAITPKVGGVGPLTVTALFEHVLMAARDKN